MFFFFCPDGIIPNSGLTGPNNTLYIYMYIYILHLETDCFVVSSVWLDTRDASNWNQNPANLR